MVGLDHWPQSDGQSESIWGWGASALDPYPLRWHQAVSAWWHRCGTLGRYWLGTLAGREDRALPGQRPAALAAFRYRYAEGKCGSYARRRFIGKAGADDPHFPSAFRYRYAEGKCGSSAPAFPIKRRRALSQIY